MYCTGWFTERSKPSFILMRPHFSQFSPHTSGNQRERAEREAAAAAKAKKEGEEKNKQKVVTVIVTTQGYYTESFYSSYFFTPAACLSLSPVGSFLNFFFFFFFSLSVSLYSCIAWTFSLSLWCMLMRAVKKEARRGRQKERERVGQARRTPVSERKWRCAMCSSYKESKPASRSIDDGCNHVHHLCTKKVGGEWFTRVNCETFYWQLFFFSLPLQWLRKSLHCIDERFTFFPQHFSLSLWVYLSHLPLSLAFNEQ